MPLENASGYNHNHSELSHTHSYLFPTVLRTLKSSAAPRVFELGCGNGATCRALTANGYDVIGVDPSVEGVRIANAVFSHLKIEIGSAYDDLVAKYGCFPALISLEVIEHVFYPRTYAKCVYELLEPGGIAIISTPYHGYWKNITLALSGKMDAHFTALWDYGHIKFWSIRTITALLEEAGLIVEEVFRVGRIPTFAKSMVVVARRPASA